MSFLCSHIKYLGLNLGTEPMFFSSNELHLPSLTLSLPTTSLLQPVFINCNLRAAFTFGHTGSKHRRGTAPL